MTIFPLLSEIPLSHRSPWRLSLKTPMCQPALWDHRRARAQPGTEIAPEAPSLHLTGVTVNNEVLQNVRLVVST